METGRECSIPGTPCPYHEATYERHFLQDIIAEDPATHGAMFVPVILGSDKTTVSVATGQNEYYPLYLSIGNVHNAVRRAHRNAVQVLAFLAIPHGQYYLYVIKKKQSKSL